jgi:flagellar motor switch protein FliM
MLDILAGNKIDLLGSVKAPQLRSVLMETLSARFMRQIAFGLVQQTRHSVQLLSCEGIVDTHEAVMGRLPDVLLAGISDLSPLRGRALLAIDGDLIGAIVDAMCGATTAHPFVRSELSAMETRIGRQMISLVYKTVEEALSPLVHINLSPLAYETGNGMLAIADGQEWLIEVTGVFQTAIGQGAIKVIIPHSSFEPLEQKVQAQAGLIGNRTTDDAWFTSIERLTEGIPLPVRFEVARASVPISIVNQLKAGTVLPFYLFPEAIASSGGVDLFQAEFGQFNGYVSCRVRPEPTDDGVSSMSENNDLSAGIGGSAGVRVELDRLSHTPKATTILGGKNILDRVQVVMSVELGRTNIAVKDMRTIHHGQVIPLDQMVGEPLAIYANGHKIAFGEVVAGPGGERYGVRVTALADETEHHAEVQV